MYNLQGNDDCIVSFSKDELIWCIYPRSVFIDEEAAGGKDAIMPVHCMTGAELLGLREFLRLRGRLGEIAVRDIPPVVFDANIMNRDGRTPTGYKLFTWQPLVTIENMPSWTSEYNGIAAEYLAWVAAIQEEDLFHWLEAADYIGCKDIVYLIQIYCAYLYVHMVNAYMKGGAGGVAGFRVWAREDREENRRQHRFIKHFDALRETHPILCEQIMTRFVRHRGFRLPRAEWTDADWAGFYRDAPAFYIRV